MSNTSPLIVGMGGTARAGSTSELIVRSVLAECERLGARTQLFDGLALSLPMYTPGAADRTPEAAALIDGLRRADGIVLASPGYHGSVSGLIKNALDYVEDMAKDERAYFEGRAVGLIAVAAGWQATGTTLATLRAIVHALRGWPTPMAVTINSMSPIFGDNGEIADEATRRQLCVLAGQVVHFARLQALDDLARDAHAAESPE
jgi:FMN reductase